MAKQENQSAVCGTMKIVRRRGVGFVRQAASRDHDAQPGDVRGGSGQRGDHRAALCGARPGRIRIQSADHAVAVVHRAVRELRRSHGGRPRQGAGRHVAASARRRPWRTACCADGKTETVPGSKLRSGDMVLVEAGEFVPGDGEIVEGVASVDESAITGESAPVIREAGGDRSAVTGGTRVLSDWVR